MFWEISPFFCFEDVLIKAKKKGGNDHTKRQRANDIGIQRRRGEEEARKCQKKPKPKQRRRREPEALGEKEVREGAKRGLRRRAEAPQQGDEGAPTTRTTRRWDRDEAAGRPRRDCG